MTIEEFPEASQMLAAEGENYAYSYLSPSNTFVFDDNGMKGFFTIRVENNTPSIRHFLVKKEFRNIKNSFNLMRICKQFMKDIGFKKIFIVVKKKRLMKLIEYFFRVSPYDKKHGFYFYLVEV